MANRGLRKRGCPKCRWGGRQRLSTSALSYQQALHSTGDGGWLTGCISSSIPWNFMWIIPFLNPVEHSFRQRDIEICGVSFYIVFECSARSLRHCHIADFHPFKAMLISPRSNIMIAPCTTRHGYKDPRALQPFYILKVNDKQTAAQVIPQHITPLTVAVDNSVRLEQGQCFLALLVKEAGILIIDDMLKPHSRPAQDHHLGHQFAVVPIRNARLESQGRQGRVVLASSRDGHNCPLLLGGDATSPQSPQPAQPLREEGNCVDPLNITNTRYGFKAKLSRPIGLLCFFLIKSQAKLQRISEKFHYSYRSAKMVLMMQLYS